MFHNIREKSAVSISTVSTHTTVQLKVRVCHHPFSFPSSVYLSKRVPGEKIAGLSETFLRALHLAR